MQPYLARIAIAMTALAACAIPARADVVTDWNGVLLNAIRTTSTNPPRASRAMAMVHGAVFDAVNGLEGQPYAPYAQSGDAPHAASTKAAAAAAAHRVLLHLYPALQSTLDAALAQSLQGIPPPLRNRGVNWGRQCADAIIALRANDGSNTITPYTPVPGPGVWIPTPPAFAPALLPNWPLVTCWTMDSGDQFRPAGAPSLVSEAYTTAFNEVKTYGRIDSVVRTAEQTQIALFWADGAGTVTPPGHWNRIASGLADQRHLSLLESARLLAMVNFAMADAAICSWDAKYAFNHWRPVTAIRAADTDGNSETAVDAAWTPLIATPPFPSYTSGHSTFSSAAATVLAGYFRIDAMPFSTTSDGLPGVTRSFTSFSAAAAEAGQSRIYGGIHWQYDNQDALAAGQALAHHLLDNFFQLIGDLDHDGDVDSQDQLALLAAWGACPGGASCPADLNGDGIVNSRDLVMLVHRFTH